MNCDYCNRIISNIGSLAAHEKCCANNPNRVRQTRSPLAGAKKGIVAWNKGLTKETTKSIRVAAENLKEKFKTGELIPVMSGKKHTDDAKKKMSLRGGGYRMGGGVGKKGWYNGYWCDSSWELAFVIYSIENKIEFTRNTKRFPYDYEGKKRYWLPDFIVAGAFVEVKGYMSKQVYAKLAAFPHDITVISKEEIQPYLKYVTDKYGNDFIRLYEKR